MLSRLLGFLFLSIALTGCVRASSVPRPEADPVRVLAIPAVTESTSELSGARIDSALGAGLSAGTRLVVVREDGEVASACVGSSACLRELGAESDVAFVLTCTVVTLGDTAVVRVRLVPVADSGTEQVRQTIVSTSDPAAIEGAARAIGADLASPFVPSQRDPGRTTARRRWRWLGPVIGVAAAGAAATAVVLTRDRDPDPDVVITPP